MLPPTPGSTDAPASWSKSTTKTVPTLSTHLWGSQCPSNTRRRRLSFPVLGSHRYPCYGQHHNDDTNTGHHVFRNPHQLPPASTHNRTTSSFTSQLGTQQRFATSPIMSQLSKFLTTMFANANSDIHGRQSASRQDRSATMPEPFRVGPARVVEPLRAWGDPGLGYRSRKLSVPHGGGVGAISALRGTPSLARFRVDAKLKGPLPGRGHALRSRHGRTLRVAASATGPAL